MQISGCIYNHSGTSGIVFIIILAALEIILLDMTIISAQQGSLYNGKTLYGEMGGHLGNIGRVDFLNYYSSKIEIYCVPCQVWNILYFF
jgi:hypothetical protein